MVFRRSVLLILVFFRSSDISMEGHVNHTFMDPQIRLSCMKGQTRSTRVVQGSPTEDLLKAASLLKD